MTWRMAESLEVLRKQLNELFPNRSKVSDGGIGNAEHAARTSDHNPYIKDKKGVGVVTARDFTFDDNPKDGIGIDCEKLAAILVAHKDPRIKYIIWNRRIISSKQQAWKWRPYSGKNAHKHHLHLSVMPEENLFDSKAQWNLSGLVEIADSKTSAAAKPSDSKSSLISDSQSGSTADILPGTSETATQEPPPIVEPATEQKTIDAPEGKTEVVSTVNEQPVSEPALITEPAPQGVAAKLKAGIGTLVGGTMLYTVAEKFGAMSFSTQAIILFAVVAFIALLGFMFWAALDAYKQNKRLELTVLANTDKNRRDVQWVKPE